MDTTSSAKRQEKVLEIVQENTLQMLDLPPAQAQWIHAGDIADKLGMDRTNVARELNKLYRDGQLISDQPKPRNIPLQPGDVIEMTTAGAGGYGPVSQRDPELLRKELREGIINEAWLKEAGIEL